MKAQTKLSTFDQETDCRAKSQTTARNGLVEPFSDEVVRETYLVDGVHTAAYFASRQVSATQRSGGGTFALTKSAGLDLRRVYLG